MTTPIHCPHCGSTLFWKDGMRYLPDGSAIQRYVCRSCGRRLSEPSCKTEKQNYKPILLERAPLTLEAQTEKRDAGAAGQTLDGAKIKEVIINFVWWMRKQGYAESTIERRSKILEVLAKRGANLYDPESVKETLARQKWDENS
ncbi:MAG: zinc ribbon domain-containing protein, partial [Candidatus Bathyarchaeia archaeon]